MKVNARQILAGIAAGGAATDGLNSTATPADAALTTAELANAALLP